jgi:hypothetical protein
MTAAGFPHSGITGSTPACGSPMLFAAYHALPRLSVPRHPPCALVRLTGSLSLWIRTPSTSKSTHTLPSGAPKHPLPQSPKLSIELLAVGKEERDRARTVDL